MDIQYKPTKKKEKPAKAPKAPKAEKAMKFSPTVQAVKTGKPKKEKTPKIKTPKPEKVKAMEFGKPVKAEKAEAFKGMGNQSRKRKIWITAASIAVVLAVVLVAAFVLPGGGEEEIGSIESMILMSRPDKTVYEVGEELNCYGLKVRLAMKGGVIAVLEAKDCKITGFDSSKPVESQTITVSYEKFSITFNVSIVEKQEETSPPALFTGVSFKTLPQTEYTVNEWLDVSGGVLLLQYEDGTTREVPLEREYVFGFTTSEPGTYTVTVKYEERGYLYETTYTITVTE